MAIFDSAKAKVLMPRQILDGMIAETRSNSLVAKLSGQDPMRFGEADIITFNNFPKAEFVEEGAQKSATEAEFGVVTAKPHKAQVTLRFNEEVLWADEDYQLGVLNEVAAAGQVALARALDLGVFHRINPLIGEVISGWDTYIGASTKTVERGSAAADVDLRAAAGLLINDTVDINGIALDGALAWDLASLETPQGAQKYPTLGLGTNVESFLGLNAAQGSTVSGKPEAKEDTGVRAIVGDFAQGLRWGIQRNLWVEKILYGNPDGQGDLKHNNQVALRLEIVYGWYVNPEKFALVKTAEAGA